MKLLTASVLASLLVGSVGLANLVPAFADDPAPAGPAAAAPATPGPWQHHRFGDHRGRPGMGEAAGLPGRGMRPGGLFALACGERGAEALAVAFVHVEYRVKPTAEQQPLFDALKTAALAGQKSVADACGTPAATAAPPNLLDRMQAGLAVRTAEVAALNEVMPRFKAFYDSLTDQQKAALEPRWQAGRAMGAQPGSRMHRPMRGPGYGPGGAPAAAPAGPADTAAPTT